MSRVVGSRVLALCLALAAPLAVLVQPATAQQKPPPATIRIVDIPIANFTPLLIAKEKGEKDPWDLKLAAGGLTDLDNAVPLCGRHHHMIDSALWRHVVTQLGNGTVSLAFHRRT